jgi:hypothetical protein
MKCPICGKDFPKGKRAVNAHMLKDHKKEYAEKGYSLAAFGVKDEPPKKLDPPEGFRVLDLDDKYEKMAYEAGYRYIDDQENVYDRAEAKRNRWIA